MFEHQFQFALFSQLDIPVSAPLRPIQRHFRHRRHARAGLPLLEVPEVISMLQGKKDALIAARARFYAVLDASWAQVAGGAAPDTDAMQAVQASSLDLGAVCRAGVDGLYPYCGLYAAREDSTINRVWRDFHTASQHSLLLP